MMMGAGGCAMNQGRVHWVMFAIVSILIRNRFAETGHKPVQRVGNDIGAKWNVCVPDHCKSI